MGRYRILLCSCVLVTINIVILLQVKGYIYELMISKFDHKCSLGNNQEEQGKLLPRSEIIDTMSNVDRDELYWVQVNSKHLFDLPTKYVNSLQIFCKNQMRFGSLKDGGKYLCLDKPYKPERNCLVYSFGSNFQFDFEEAVYSRFHCEIHTFDPSKSLKKHTVPEGIHFHLLGLGPENILSKRGWNIKTFKSLKTTFNHTKRAIDIMKVDIESWEWSALHEMLKSGSLHNVKQLCIELHYKTQQSKQQLRTLRQLYEAGFHIFMHEPNHEGHKKLRYPYHSMTTLNELSMINVNWNNSRNNFNE